MQEWPKNTDPFQRHFYKWWLIVITDLLGTDSDIMRQHQACCIQVTRVIRVSFIIIIIIIIIVYLSRSLAICWPVPPHPPKYAGPEAKGSNPTTGHTLLCVRNPFRGYFNHWQVSRKEAGEIFFKRQDKLKPIKCSNERLFICKSTQEFLWRVTFFSSAGQGATCTSICPSDTVRSTFPLERFIPEGTFTRRDSSVINIHFGNRRRS